MVVAVRFGKYVGLRRADKKVHILVNGKHFLVQIPFSSVWPAHNVCWRSYKHGSLMYAMQRKHMVGWRLYVT